MFKNLMERDFHLDSHTDYTLHSICEAYFMAASNRGNLLPSSRISIHKALKSKDTTEKDCFFTLPDPIRTATQRLKSIPKREFLEELNGLEICVTKIFKSSDLKYELDDIRIIQLKHLIEMIITLYNDISTSELCDYLIDTQQLHLLNKPTDFLMREYQNTDLAPLQ